jgi:hypothetical protein
MNPFDNKINWKSKSVEELIYWDNMNVHEPSLTKHIPTEIIEERILSDNPQQLFFQFPCHSQSAERYVPLMSNCTDKVCEEQRDGFMLATLDSRKDNPNFETKHEYNVIKFHK